EAFFSAKDLNGRNIAFKAESSNKFTSAENAEQFLQSSIGAAYTVNDIQVKPTRKSPSAPFTTSTLQQEASRKLGYSVSKSMLLAQKLYESGKITYMRTDAVSLSETAQEDIKNAIHNNYGNKYWQQRKFKNKNESAQEAHEAIRPTYMENSTVEDADTRKLYELIWKRTIASQMSDAELEKTVVKIDIVRRKDASVEVSKISFNNSELSATGEVLKFDGFLKIYMEGKDEEDGEEGQEGMLPPLKVGQALDFQEMKATERFSRPAARYTEASLVKRLEELGIGRPSTYAPTISTVQKRKYVEKRDKDGVERVYRILLLKADKITKATNTEMTGAERAKLFPTDLGMLVTDFLKQYFDSVMDYGFTARIEEEFDEIALGKKVWNKMIDEFYKPFHEDVESTLENAERVKGERLLGNDPASAKPVFARMGRYGPMVQIGNANEEEKPRFAKLKPTQSIETITLEEAMELFRLPRNIGLFEGEEVVINIGRFGPYAMHDKKFYSLKKEMDPYTVEIDEIAPLIEEKRKAKNERTIKVFEKEKIQILNGPYGPYIKQGLKNYKIPKEKTDHAANLTLEECKAIIEEAKANPPKRRPAKKKA
ncbi:MAG TPA: DNA topoisomerase, partial [Chitinophagaceae bacterium]